MHTCMHKLQAYKLIQIHTKSTMYSKHNAANPTSKYTETRTRSPKVRARRQTWSPTELARRESAPSRRAQRCKRESRAGTATTAPAGQRIWCCIASTWPVDTIIMVVIMISPLVFIQCAWCLVYKNLAARGGGMFLRRPVSLRWKCTVGVGQEKLDWRFGTK